uniref:Uncharacterized protein n=1 Tax=Anguilla anguilla TaxID=7936 RepID=A0A0E9S4A3_ANGAN
MTMTAIAIMNRIKNMLEDDFSPFQKVFLFGHCSVGN